MAGTYKSKTDYWGVVFRACAPLFCRASQGRRLLLIGLLTLWAGASVADSPTPLEYKLKGAFLLNFAKFVKWPPEAFADTESPVVIGIVGQDPFGSALDQLVAGETINGRKVIVKRFSELDDITKCQMLFIDKSANVSEILKRVDSAGIVTVGETDGFLESGGMISFLIEENKIRFAVNTGAAQRAKLTISSQLLKLARRVKP